MSESRRETRYPIRPFSRPTTTMSWGGGAEVEAELLEVSQNGFRACFAGESPPAIGDKISLQLEKGYLERPIEASVRWVAFDIDYGWVVGCFTRRMVPHQLLTRFAREERVERRNEERAPVDCPAAAKKVGEKTYAPVQLSDIAPGGCRAVATSLELATGDEVLIRLPGEDDAPLLVRAVVSWTTRNECGGTNFGCNIASRSEFREMEKSIHRISGGKTQTDVVKCLNATPGSTSWSFVGALVALIILVSEFV